MNDKDLNDIINQYIADAKEAVRTVPPLPLQLNLYDVTKLLARIGELEAENVRLHEAMQQIVERDVENYVSYWTAATDKIRIAQAALKESE